MTEHGHERDNTRSAGDQQQRVGHARLPDEVAADGSTHFDAIPGDHDIMQIRGDFSIVDALHGNIHFAFAFGLRGDRITALRLIAILGRQADVIMLTGAVAHPGRAV